VGLRGIEPRTRGLKDQCQVRLQSYEPPDLVRLLALVVRLPLDRWSSMTVPLTACPEQEPCACQPPSPHRARPCRHPGLRESPQLASEVGSLLRGELSIRGAHPDRVSRLSLHVSRRRLRRRAALGPMQPQARARGVRPPAGPRAARGCGWAAGCPERRLGRSSNTRRVRPDQIDSHLLDMRANPLID